MIGEPLARLRAGLAQCLREFLTSGGYLETDPPVMAAALIPESHIEVFRTSLVSPYGEPVARFLTPSPELFLKRLLAAGYGSLFSIGKAFRNAESISPRHRPEFTMVEWYGVETDADFQRLLTADLLAAIASRFPGWPGAPVLAEEPLVISMREAFRRFATMEPDALAGGEGEASDPLKRGGSPAAYDPLGRAAERTGTPVREGESVEDLFHRILVDRIEPRLPADRPVFLTDYPAFVPTLAANRPEPDQAFAERWELYLAGMEVANCYTEERDPGRLRAYLRYESALKQNSLVPHPSEDALLEFAQAPGCSGVALGFDRLLMALAGVDEITGVIFFP